MSVDINEVMQLVRETRQFVENRDMAGHVKVKGLADYVTQVDTNIQNFLREKLGELAPEVEFLGEEDGLHAMKGDTFWILDPIDGTTNLVHDYQHSTVSLGLYSKGEIILGVIYDPFREEMFYAEKGKGGFVNGIAAAYVYHYAAFLKHCYTLGIEHVHRLRRVGKRHAYNVRTR